MEIEFIVESLIPIFGLIALGYALVYCDFPGAGFWPLAEKLTYYILFPSLLLYKLATTPFSGLDVWSMVAALVFALSVVVVLLIALKSKLRSNNPSFTSVFQGSIRPNTYIGVAAAVSLYGNEGAALAAVAIISLIPLVNVLSVFVLAHYVSAEEGSWRNALVIVAKNPLVLACILGMILNGYYQYLPRGVGQILDILGQSSLALGLLIVGAGLKLRSMTSQAQLTVLASAVKLLILPALTIIACRVLGVGYPASTVATLFAALPGAPSSYVLSRQLGGNSELMANILALETVLALITLPLVLVVEKA